MAEVGDTTRAVGGPVKRLLARSSKLQEMQLLLQTQGQAECPDKALSPIPQEASLHMETVVLKEAPSPAVTSAGRGYYLHPV